uniref:GH18 domain-containing protein n=1 Tax=Anopheles atroparvus TaxID=41427 RepID=A0A240PKK6_ANOAO
MCPTTLFVAIIPVFGFSFAFALELVCQIHLQLPIGAELAEELRHCTVYIVNSVTFDVSRSTVLSNEELSRIDVLKRSNSSADVLLTIALPFNATMLSTHQELSERIAIVLRDNSLDGVDLDLDVAQLDHYEQTRYAQFLRRLRALLRDKYKISTTIGCASLGSSSTLPKALNEQLNMVTVVGTEETTGGSLDGGSEEFTVRKYSFEPVKRLIKDGVSARKIVLSLMTVGIVFNPGSYRTTRSLQQSRVGVLSYGQVCELMVELEAKCGSISGSRKRPGCSLFGGKGVVVYDGESSVETRTKQAADMGVKGMLILPNYDDTENLCDRGPFPLLRSLRTAMATQNPARTEDELICSDGYRYGGIEEGGLYYKCYNEGLRENCCEPGTVFSDLLKICIGINVPPIVLQEDNSLVEVTEAPSDKQSFVTASLDTSTTIFPVAETTLRREPTEEGIEYLLVKFQDTLSYLDDIIKRALALVFRLEYFEQSLINGTRLEADALLDPVIDEEFFSAQNVINSPTDIDEPVEVVDSEESDSSPAGSLIWPFR